MFAAVLEKYGNVVWKEMPEPDCNPGEVLIRVAYGSICGSDQHIHKGEFHPRTSTPMIMGHEFAGQIVKTGSGVEGFSVGDHVAPDPIIWCGECPACRRGHYPACTRLKLIGIDLDGGFAQFISLPASMLYKVPSSIALDHAALIEVLSIGFHAKNKAAVKENDVLAIWGSGKVGLSILEAVRTVTDQTIFMVDVLDERLAIAAAAYDRIVPINAMQEDPVHRIMEETGDQGVDIAFEAVGHAHPASYGSNPVWNCVRSIRGGGTVCVLGLGNDVSEVLFKDLIWKEGSIVASRVSHGEFSETIQNLEKGKLKPEVLISATLPAFETQKAFDLLEQKPAENIKILLDFTTD